MKTFIRTVLAIASFCSASDMSFVVKPPSKRW